MVATQPLAVALSAVFIVSGALTLACTPDPGRPMTRFAQPAMSAAMLAMTWTRLGSLVLSWPAVLFTAFAGCVTLDAVQRTGSDRVARALTAAASVWMLVAMPAPGSGPGRLTTLAVCAGLLATSAFWTARALPGRTVRADAAPADPDGWPAGPAVWPAGRDGWPADRDGWPADPAARSVGSAVRLASPAVLPAPAVTAHSRLAARTDAGGHALMALGMMAMLMAMLAGW